MFDESKHKRDEDGKFAKKDGHGYSDDVNGRIKWAKDNDIELPLNDYGAVDDFALQRLRDSNRMKDIPSPRSKNKSREEFFGEEFKGVKGKDAVEKLLKEKRGHVKNAFERPEIGGIDLVWGDENGGLQHTILRRDKMLLRGTGTISGIDMARKIPDIVEKGEFNIDEHDRLGFNHDGYRVAVRPSYDGQKLNWIVSAMEIMK